MPTEATRRALPTRVPPDCIAGYTVLEIAVVMVILLVITAAVGSAFGTGGEIYGDGMLSADLNADARGVLNRILEEIEETQSDSPDFAVGADFITYNRVVAISATAPTFGPQRTITIDKDTTTISLTVSDPSAMSRVTEELSREATGLAFKLDGSRLTVGVSITKTNARGAPITRTVTGDVNVHR